MHGMRAKARQALNAAGVDAMLLYNPEHACDFAFHYFTAAPLNTLAGCFLLAEKTGMRLLASGLDFGAAEKIHGMGATEIESRKQLARVLRKKLGRKKLGLNYPALGCRALAGVKRIAGKRRFVDVSKHLAEVRETKTKVEIGKLKGACRITEDVIGNVCGKLKKGAREVEIAKRLEIEALKAGAQGLSFPAIVASGKNSAVPHHITSDRKIRNGDVLLIDLGVRYRNYTSDVSRVFAVGKPSEEQAATYSSVYDALKKSTKLTKAGTTAKDLYITANAALKTRTGKELAHALGHGIGLQDHDCPGGIGKKSRWKLRAGMALAIEPAVYLRNFGVRLEDNLIVQRGGCRMLTRAPRELVRV